MLAGVKNSLRYGLVGDHIDAQEALRIGLVIKVVPHDQLLDECFDLVERIALVPPETVKINLSIATLGMEMMGLRDALMLDSQLSAPAHVMLREEHRRPSERGPGEEHPGVPAASRRPLPARALRTAIEAQGIGPPARRPSNLLCRFEET